MVVVEALETDGAGLTEAAIHDLKARLGGPLIVPGEADYAAARQVYNGMIDRYPRLIARCHDVADVICAVNFGRERRLTVAVRVGGHNGFKPQRLRRWSGHRSVPDERHANRSDGAHSAC